MIFVSASQISAYRDCPRKWAWRYIAGVETAQHPAARLGTEVDDEQIQPYLRDGRAFDYTRDSGYIAASMLAFLPAPKTVEIQHHFQMPSPTWVDGAHIGFGFQGYTDIWATDSALIPGLPGGAPCVADTKTTGDLRWAKTEKQLAIDVQAMLYATACMYETGARVVDLAWIYGQTRGTRRARRTHLRVTGDHVAEQFEEINATAVEMLGIRQSGAQPLDLPPNPDQCEAYGGCPYRDKCNLSPVQIIEAHAAKAAARWARCAQETTTMASTADMLAALRAKKAAQVGTQTGPAVSAPPPVTVAAPAPPPSPPVLDGIDRAAVASLPAWATAPTDPMASKYVGAPAAPLGINPPESALPPAPPVGTPAEEKAKRTRRTKAEMEAARGATGETAGELRVVVSLDPATIGALAEAIAAAIGGAS